jgi:hypothetical protein
MVNLNYSVSVTPNTIRELPWYIQQWKINTADLVISTPGTYATELAYIKSLNLRPRIDIEVVIWNGGKILDPIRNFVGFLSGLKSAGWTDVCSEGGRAGDASYLRSLGLNYTNYNCDQCGLWRANLHTESGTTLNLWEAYYPSEVQYIMTGAMSGKPNGVLAGAWANVNEDNRILTNSINGTTPSYRSIIDSLIAAGRQVTDFEVWGGTNSSRSYNESLGFTQVVLNLQKTYPPNGSVPVPPPIAVPTTCFISVDNSNPLVGQTVTFTVFLLDNKNKPVANRPVVISHTLNGVKYDDVKLVTTASGKASFTQVFNSIAIRPYFVSFGGDSSYKASNSSLGVNVK